MKQALAPISFTLLQCSAHLRFGSRVPLGRDERLGGRGGRAKACCDRGSGEDGFCQWVEGTGPRLPRLGARRSNRREERLASSREQWWLGARWTMNASVLRSNKEFSSQLQETNGFEIVQLMLCSTLRFREPCTTLTQHPDPPQIGPKD